MKFLMLVCWDAEKMDAQTEPDPTDTQERGELSLARRPPGAGHLGHRRPTRSAAPGPLVRVRDGKRIVTDGPFAETKEVVGGFDIIECGSMEEAVEIAAGHPTAENGTIEVRPLWGN